MSTSDLFMITAIQHWPGTSHTEDPERLIIEGFNQKDLESLAQAVQCGEPLEASVQWHDETAAVKMTSYLAPNGTPQVWAEAYGEKGNPLTFARFSWKTGQGPENDAMMEGMRQAITNALHAQEEQEEQPDTEHTGPRS